VQVRAKLRFGTATRGDGDYSGEFPRFQVQARARMNITEDEFDNVVGHIRGDAGDIFNGLFAGGAEHLFQFGAAELGLFVVRHLGSLGLSAELKV
jgi:hypothetical protein